MGWVLTILSQIWAKNKLKLILSVLWQQLGQKFDCPVSRSKIILGSSFEQTW